jgi:nuclear cap-binding protein subunit 1
LENPDLLCSLLYTFLTLCHDSFFYWFAVPLLQTVPNRAMANGVILRTLVNDAIDIFEVNRKECAKILLELPRGVGRGTFKTKASSSTPKPEENGDHAEEPVEASSEWILEHLLLEVQFPVILSSFC